MTFHYSAEDIRVDDGHILRARLQKADGEWNDAEIDLNEFIGNDNGRVLVITQAHWSYADLYIGYFVWDGQGFSGSAENVHFTIEGEGSVPVLRATLFDGDGNGNERDINLGERVGNNDGNFSYSMSLSYPSSLLWWLTSPSRLKIFSLESNDCCYVFSMIASDG
jgi:hypothetical protein